MTIEEVPSQYPLPWCERLNMPYWQINIGLCLRCEGWREKQSRRPMSEIISWIDEIMMEENER